MIGLLFDNDEIAKFKFTCNDAYISFRTRQNIDVRNFTLEPLVISKYLTIDFESNFHDGESEEEDNKILLKLLLCEGSRIPEIRFDRENLTTLYTLYNLLINHLETSTDLSKMVADIGFCCRDWPRSKLIVRGVETNESNNGTKCYKITNIHDPKMMFSILWEFKQYRNDLWEFKQNRNDLIEFITINRVI